MTHFIDVAIFSAIVLVAILLLARYPNSWLGRIAFTRLGPAPLRSEPRSRRFLHWAGFAAEWLAQAVFAFLIGWLAWGAAPSLADSLPFIVLWLVVVPLLAVVSLAGTLAALVAYTWRRHVGAERTPGARSGVVKT
jgi:hypothetical protein